MSGRILVLPALQELEKLLRPSFLEQTHERALHSFHLRARYFRDLAITINKAASNLLELEVTCHIGVNEDLGQFTRGNDEFGDQINGVVAITSKLSRRGLISPELAVELAPSLSDRYAQ